MFMNIDKLNLEMLKINYFEKDSGQADFKGIIIESNPSKVNCLPPLELWFTHMQFIFEVELIWWPIRW